MPASPLPEPREAGRELDALIAERVMRVAPKDVRVRGEAGTPLVRVWSENPFWREDGRHDRYELTMHGGPRPYSTDLATAWTVVEEMQRRGWDGALRRVSDGYSARFESAAPPYWGVASIDPRDGEPALAICLAALAALTSETAAHV